METNMDEKSGAFRVSGNGCPKGAQYAEEECIRPTRIVTSTVRVQNRPDTMVSVRTEQSVPREQIPAVMRAIRALKVDAPVRIGSRMALTTPAGTEAVTLVATKTVELYSTGV